ncbi:MAG TPA: hypothetical protein VFU35_06365, partial [Jatrophihabitans sp.]|nr:hypothetical protein [Jatrophihabitans sp.]
EPDQLAPLCGHDHTNKTSRGWRLIRLDPHTFRWISPLGRRHHVDLPPVAAPLPDPIPRPEQVDPFVDDYDTSPDQAFTPLDQHGRPVPGPAAQHRPDREHDRPPPEPDPPPF